MIKNLRFVKGSVEISHKPLKQTRILEDRGDGRLVQGLTIASGGYKEIRSKVGFSTLRVKEEFFDDLYSSLEWCSYDYLSFTFTKFKKVGNKNIQIEPEPDKKGFIEVEVPGRFEPDLSTEDLHQLVSDWKLLHQHYPEYRNLVKPDFDPKLTQVLFDVLIDKVIQQKRDADVPEWALRALEIKRSVK